MLARVYNICLRICDQACKNQQWESKKLPHFPVLLYYNLQTVCTNTIKSLSLLQNLMGIHLKFTEMEYHIQS